MRAAERHPWERQGKPGSGSDNQSPISGSPDFERSDRSSDAGTGAFDFGQLPPWGWLWRHAGHGGSSCGGGHSGPVTLLDPATQPKFVNELPTLPQINAERGGRIVIEMRQFKQWLGLVDASGAPLKTTVWGYGQRGSAPSYPGPTINAETGVPLSVKWVNRLPPTGPLLPIDTSVHMDPGERRALRLGLTPTVVHQHGGHHSSQSDGLPDQWFTQGDLLRGDKFTSNWDHYPNDQEGADLWYHDHALGMTRINVGSGLAGMYLLHDAREQSLIAAGVLPDAAHNVQAIVQDRAFTSDGRLYLPAYRNDPMPGTGQTLADELPPDYSGPFPSIVPEFLGDYLLVNGMTWPKFDAAPTQYEFHFLNASDSRFYVLRLDDPSVKATLVGVDGGLLPHAITVMNGDGVQQPGEELLLAPSDRMDVVFDFSHSAGKSITLENVGPDFSPFQGFNSDGTLAGSAVAATPDESVGEVMHFNVSGAPAQQEATVTDGTPLSDSYIPLNPADAAKTRQLGLFEVADPYGRAQPLLGVAQDTTDINGDPVKFGPLHWDDPATETPKLNTTEIWNFYNFTEDAHPIHVHLVEYQVLGRSQIGFTDLVDNADPSNPTPDGIPDDVNGDGKITIGTQSDPLGANDIVVGGSVPLRPEELGPQDTVTVAPGQMVSVIMHFDLPGEFVWHCHMLSHEDYDMMRPFDVIGGSTSSQITPSNVAPSLNAMAI